MYEGPRKIVIVGGGLAGLAAFDAITEALASCPTLPDGIEVALVEAREVLGGRACSERVLGPTARHPYAPHAVCAPHGIHFIWGGYAHTYRLLGPELVATLTPARGTSTYCLWMAPPDVPGDARSPGRVVAMHVCDPSRPDDAWRAPARAILRAARRRTAATGLMETVLQRTFGLRVRIDDLLSYMDVLFDEEHIGPELRWTMLLTGALTASMGAPETNQLLRLMLGRPPQDAEIGELLQPFFAEWIGRKLDAFAQATDVLGLRHGGSRGPRGGEDDGRAQARAPNEIEARADALRAVAELTALLARDAARIAARAGGHDPRASGYVKNVLKAAFSSPYGLDVATAMRDAQFGLRNYEGAALQLFDGDDSSAVWHAIAERALARADGRFSARLLCPRVAARIVLDERTRAVREVRLAHGADRAPPDVPTLRPATPGPISETLPADAVVATLLPACLGPLIPDAPTKLRDDLRELGRYANDTLNLQLFLPRRIELPFPPAPATAETPPFSISNIEGPFTIIVDLRRGWSAEKVGAIRLTADSPEGTFDGTAWELVGNYADLFSHDARAHAGRYQWPLAVQQHLAHLLHDPSEIDPSAVDTRPWQHDCGAPGRLVPPLFGEILPAHRDAYQARWSELAGPIIVAETLRQIAAMPGLDAESAEYLRSRASLVVARSEHDVRWVLSRNGHAENRFFSAEPGIFHRRPHARFETEIPGLWVAGDWTRNGLDVQAMEPAIISGLQAAAGLLERMRAAGLPLRALPRIDPSVLPEGAWDAGPDV
jgi:hypothetical protein